MNELTRTGGARIGWVNATWPFARLIVTAEKLKLHVTFIGKYEFLKGQIISINKYGFIPILASGIKIVHNVESYPRSIIFWTLGSPKNLIAKIEETGLLSGKPDNSEQPILQKKGFPVKILPIVAAIVIWNLLILADQNLALNQSPGKPGTFTIIAIAFLFTTSLAIKKSTTVANLFLKSGRSVGEIAPMLNLLIFVSGAMLIIFTLIQTPSAS